MQSGQGAMGTIHMVLLLWRGQQMWDPGGCSLAQIQLFAQDFVSGTN